MITYRGENYFTNEENDIKGGITKQEVKKHKIFVDKIHIGMTIQELKNVYGSSEFIKAPVH